MEVAPFKVKAIYAYKSEHDDDLKFPEAQIITVTEEEDDDWYVGSYVDSNGETQSGLFPKNFVERYEPAPPPRPVRAARPKPAEAPIMDTQKEATSPHIPAASKPKPEEPELSRQAGQPAPSAPSEEPVSPPVAASKPVESKLEPPPAPKPAAASPAKGPPPPVAEKTSSFKDRLAAFNNPTAAPITPFKPGGMAPSSYIKKPFVAPPPSRNAYVPPVRNEPPPKVYRREEDPEIAERRAQDEEAAEKAGLAPSGEAEAQEDDAPKLSLKERIANLQKSQMEQAARRSEGTPKEKPKRPPKKRTESHDPENAPARDSIDTESERPPRGSSDAARAPKAAKSPEALPREKETFSDANDADQSAAGETTEEADRDSTTEEEPAIQRHEQAPLEQPEVGDEEDETEEEEEVDEEAQRQQALRERMAKLSGGMGMGSMFGPPGGMPGPGVGGAFKKKKPAPERKPAEDAEPSSAPLPPQRIPVIPMPGMGRTLSHDSDVTAGNDDDHPITGQRSSEERPDVEDIIPTSPPRAHGAERTVPARPQEHAAPQPPHSSDRGIPPPVPSGRPSTESRPAPQAPIDSPSAGSETDNEGTELPVRAAPPPIPSRDGGPLSPTNEPRSPPPRSSTDRDPTSPTSPSDKRSHRLPPTIPMSSPTMAPAAQARPPPPPPPTAPPTHQPTSDSLHRRALGTAGEGESEYEGDYDTDIASNTKHKDALSAHARESSLDESTAAEDTPVRSPVVSSAGFSSAPRAVPPPLPPSQAPPPTSRKSADTPRAAPPPVPSREPGDDEEYDPYSYIGGPTAAALRGPPPAPRQPSQPAPPPATRQPPQPPAIPTMPPPPPIPTRQQLESDESEEDDLYRAPPTRKSTDQPRKSSDRAPPPLPTQAPPQHERAPPPLPPQAPPQPAHYDAPPPPAGQAPVRLSMDQERSYTAAPRVSTDPQLGRASLSGHRPEVGDFIANGTNLAPNSRWWMQANAPPPELQGRPDVLYEVEESGPDAHGMMTKKVYILFQDYSQNVITVHYDPRNADNVEMEQHQEAPPSKLRQDQLENFWSRFGSVVFKSVQAAAGSGAVGDGSAPSLVQELLRPLKGALAPVGTRSFGALVYANLGNATVQQFDEIRPGDIVTFRNVKLSGKHGGLHAKYSVELAAHVGVVVEWDGTKKKLRAAEQGKAGGDGAEGSKPGKEKASKKKGKVEVESYRLGDLRSGEVRVWRIVSRGYVGWIE